MTHLDKYLRTSAMTARALAEAVGVSQPYITDLRYGRRNPSPGVAARIAIATDDAVPAASWPTSTKAAS